jgi:hypothetical protein
MGCLTPSGLVVMGTSSGWLVPVYWAAAVAAVNATAQAASKLIGCFIMQELLGCAGIKLGSARSPRESVERL